MQRLPYDHDLILFVNRSMIHHLNVMELIQVKAFLHVMLLRDLRIQLVNRKHKQILWSLLISMYCFAKPSPRKLLTKSNIFFRISYSVLFFWFETFFQGFISFPKFLFYSLLFENLIFYRVVSKSMFVYQDRTYKIIEKSELLLSEKFKQNKAHTYDLVKGLTLF